MKAHVLPKAFYELRESGAGPYKSVTDAVNIFPKKIPVGLYDKTMVTEEGERTFQLLDDYGTRLLLKRDSAFQPFRHTENILGWTLLNYDYPTLKLFALSILWRAHASTPPEFKNVRLGPHEARVRHLLLNATPGTPEEYSVVIVKWIDEEFGPVFMDPFRETYDGLNYYRIYLGRYVLYFKVDQRRTNAAFRDFQLGQDTKLVVIARELKKSKERPLMQKLARLNTDKLDNSKTL
ncbi:MAG: hypothetical protein QM771_19685 [Nitrospira sp.]